MRLIDRYLLRNFLLPFTYCIVGFLAVWLIFDLTEQASGFIESHVPVKTVLNYYLNQLPAIAVITLPVGLLLALLYSLGRMSQANEILAMLTAGVSLWRILLPFFAVGLAVTGLSAWLNHGLAPKAEAKKQELLAEMEAGNGKLEKRAVTLGHLFVNRRDDRIWFVEKLPTDLRKPLEGVQIVQQDSQEHITDKFYAKTAAFDPATRDWTFTAARMAHYSAEGEVEATSYPDQRVVSGWSETPWRIHSSLLDADKLSVPELKEYLSLNSDFTREQLAPFRTYLDSRFSSPWTCLVVVLFTAPLSIIYQRRGVLAGVAGSILIFFLILFFTNLFLALGRGDRITSWWAAWTPNLIFGFVGAVLLRVRALNRDRLPVTPALVWDFLTA